MYTFGVESAMNEDDIDSLVSNYHIGEAYKGFASIEKAFKYFKQNSGKNKK